MAIKAEEITSPQDVLQVIFSPDRPTDIYPYFHRMRTLAPVFEADLHGRKIQVMSSYATVSKVARDMKAYSDDEALKLFSTQNPQSSFDQMLHRLLVFLPRPDHDRIRGMVIKAFTPNAVAARKPVVRQVVDRLLNDIKGDEFDLVSDFAYPLPVFMICQFMGIPHEDAKRFMKWAHDYSIRFDNASRLGADIIEAGEEATRAFDSYFRDLIKLRRDNPGNDLMSELIALKDEKGTLTDDELIATALLLLIAGHSTTADLIGMGTRNLLLNPNQWQLLVNQPELASGAVMELLRYEVSVQLTQRVLAEPMTLGDLTLPEGTLCMLFTAAANRDPETFPDPDRLDITRRGPTAVPFGGGPYVCLGQHLARLQAQEAFLGLTQRFPDLALASDEAEYTNTSIARGLKRLPLKIHARRTRPAA